MQVIDISGKKIKAGPNPSKADSRDRPTEAQCVDTAISLMSNLVETACEHSPDLDLVRLVNLMDHYCIYLQLARDPESDLHQHIKDSTHHSDSVVTAKLGETSLISFERFVRDSRLLKLTAMAASYDSGDVVAPPLPLTVSAND